MMNRLKMFSTGESLAAGRKGKEGGREGGREGKEGGRVRREGWRDGGRA